jgi:hypothetical protein
MRQQLLVGIKGDLHVMITCTISNPNTSPIPITRRDKVQLPMAAGAIQAFQRRRIHGTIGAIAKNRIRQSCLRLGRGLVGRDYAYNEYRASPSHSQGTTGAVKEAFGASARVILQLELQSRWIG